MKYDYKKYCLLTFKDEEVSIWKRNIEHTKYYLLTVIKGVEDEFADYITIYDFENVSGTDEKYIFSNNLQELKEQAMLEIL